MHLSKLTGQGERHESVTAARFAASKAVSEADHDATQTQ
jgi:hypothetical protein